MSVQKEFKTRQREDLIDDWDNAVQTVDLGMETLKELYEELLDIIYKENGEIMDEYVKLADINISREEDKKANKIDYYWILYRTRSPRMEHEKVIDMHPFEFRNKIFVVTDGLGITLLNWKKISLMEYKLYNREV